MNDALRVGSLFSGIGGFDLGFERAGMRVVWQCEQDDYCRRVLARHWPEVPCYPDVCALVADTASVNGQEQQVINDGRGPLVGPIARAGGRTSGGISAEGVRLTGGDSVAGGSGDAGEPLPVQVPYVDVLCGGFPCQDISLAGKGAGIDGARSGLWSEYARLIGELRPRYVVVENVAALLARGMGRVLGDLAEIGYDAEWDCIPASAVGAPHRRDRLWIVAYPNSDDGGSWGLGRSSPGGEGQSQPERTLQVADASRDAEAGTGAQSRAERERAGPSRQRSRADGDWRGVEPDVRGVVDGLSTGLDGVDASAANRAVASAGESPEGSLRVLWEQVATRSAPSGRRSDEQLGRELADALSIPPLNVALESRQEAVAASLAYLRRLRQACEEIGAMRDASQPLAEAWLALSAEDLAWVALAVGNGQWAAEWPGVARVAVAIPNRVDRLRSLGNALVPQIAQWIGERIVSYEESQ